MIENAEAGRISGQVVFVRRLRANQFARLASRQGFGGVVELRKRQLVMNTGWLPGGHSLVLGEDPPRSERHHKRNIDNGCGHKCRKCPTETTAHRWWAQHQPDYAMRR